MHQIVLEFALLQLLLDLRLFCYFRTHSDFCFFLHTSKTLIYVRDNQDRDKNTRLKTKSLCHRLKFSNPHIFTMQPEGVFTNLFDLTEFII